MPANSSIHPQRSLTETRGGWVTNGMAPARLDGGDRCGMRSDQVVQQFLVSIQHDGQRILPGTPQPARAQSVARLRVGKERRDAKTELLVRDEHAVLTVVERFDTSRIRGGDDR